MEKPTPVDIEDAITTARWRARIETKLDNVLEKLETLDDHEERLRHIERDVQRHNERLGIIAGIQTAVSTLIAAVVAWVSSRI